MNHGNVRVGTGEDDMKETRKEESEIDEGKGGCACESGSNPANLRHGEQRDDTVMTPFLNSRHRTISTSFRSLSPAILDEDANQIQPFRWTQNPMHINKS